ncbi:hypothetical protein HY641_01340 [Candidatus Woesearchaeota archaeon]|nr:hypothetical protein [Candidatus Woesearchaeota archaeon]
MDITLKEVQRLQAEFDEIYREHDIQTDKVRHITRELGKLLGKLSSYCEHHELGARHEQHVLAKEIIPDLLLYSTQLSNLIGTDLGQCYFRRIEELKG